MASIKNVQRTATLAGASTDHMSGENDELVPSDEPCSVPLGERCSFHGRRKDGWNEKVLLKLCDDARANLTEGRMTESLLGRVMDFILAAVEDESRGSGSMMLEMDVIRNARLDKLLADIMSWETSRTMQVSQRQWVFSSVEELQRLWQTRFRNAYFELDNMRYYNLYTTGLLRDIVLNPDSNDDSVLWRTRHRSALSEAEENLHYTAGD
ncbi:hypothetical protein RJ55_06216 [Drechmeria coniospora]|nr:hypothetical protein RJ55_06216 [Drechmeria coniospora]